MGLIGGGGYEAPDLVKTDARSLAMNFMPQINRMGRALQRDQLNKALAISHGTMSPTDLPEFMRARQLQEAGSQRALADVADRMTQLGVSGPAAAAVLDRQRQAGTSSNLQLAQAYGDVGQARVGQGIEMGNKAISMGLQSAGIQASADANYNQSMLANAAAEGGGGGGSPLAGGLSGAMSGAGTGFMMGGPWGALAGGIAGGALGALSAGGGGGGAGGGGRGGGSGFGSSMQQGSDVGADTGMGMGMIMEMMKKYFGQGQSYAWSGRA